jgi:hypothetical protein
MKTLPRSFRILFLCTHFSQRPPDTMYQGLHETRTAGTPGGGWMNFGCRERLTPAEARTLEEIGGVGLCDDGLRPAHFAVVVLFVAVNVRRDADQFPTLFGEVAEFALIHLLELPRRRFAREYGEHFERRVRRVEHPGLGKQKSDGREAGQSKKKCASHVEV